MTLNEIKMSYRKNRDLRMALYNTIVWLSKNYDKYEDLKKYLGIHLDGEFEGSISFNGLSVIIIALLDRKHDRENNTLEYTFINHRMYKTIYRKLNEMAKNADIEVSAKKLSNRSGKHKELKLVYLKNAPQEYLLEENSENELSQE